MASRYFHTLRHLKPVQVYGRVWFRLNKPRPDTAPPPPLRMPQQDWIPSADKTSSLIAARTFRFLNQEGDLDVVGWDSPNVDRLWRYNQHYFDDLGARGFAARTAWHEALIDAWIRDNPPATGTGWEPYPTSLRVVNWIKWILAGHAPTALMVHSLAIQVRHLERRLEWHLLGNHLFANAKALVFAGLFFEGEEAARWRDLGVRILRRELPEQVLSDGGHFELSPMYHAIALEDVLDLINILAVFGPSTETTLAEALRNVVSPMRSWLGAMTHPDGDIAFFNDAAMGIAPTSAALDDYARRLGFDASVPAGQGVMNPSGYGRLDVGDACLIADVARVGPDYIPGHAHADTLSFEFSLGGTRVFVNSGVSRYGADAERLRQRGTRAHNTVVVDGRDSSEVWGGFRVARRARPLGVSVTTGPDGIVLEGGHDGYAVQGRGPVHRRQWTLSMNALVVSDTLGAADLPAEARLHLHPAVKLASGTGGRDGQLILPDGRRIEWDAAAPVRVEPSTWHPEFGISLPNICLVIPVVDGVARLSLSWS